MSDIHGRCYNWELHEITSDNQLPLKIWEQLIDKDSNSPAANRMEYIHPLQLREFPNEIFYIAICYFNDKPLTALPIKLTKHKKYCISWFDLGTPFHTHLNLFNFPNCGNHNHEALFLSLYKCAKKWSLKWNRLVINNLVSEYKFQNSIEAGDVAWFSLSDSNEVNSVISKKLCKNLLRLQKKLIHDHGDFQLDEYLCNNDDELEAFFKLEKNSWKGRAQVAVEDEVNLKKFYYEMMHNFSKTSAARIYLFQSENKVIAGALGFQLGEILYLHKVSFDDDFSAYSPGGLMIYHLLNDLLKKPHIKELNLVTSPQWANRWHPNKSRLANLVAYNSNFMGVLGKIGDPLVKKLRLKVKQNFLSFMNILKK